MLSQCQFNKPFSKKKKNNEESSQSCPTNLLYEDGNFIATSLLKKKLPRWTATKKNELNRKTQFNYELNWQLNETKALKRTLEKNKKKVK